MPAVRKCGNRVYPRVRGGTITALSEESEELGLSPRARGNRELQQPSRLGRRSIPACAGEPDITDDDDELDEVYPRVRGGTCTIAVVEPAILGLSPRARGNRVERSLNSASMRSIPACAGEPFRDSFAHICLRSIPACAGEPQPAMAAGLLSKVYPRVRGGTRCG